MPILDNTIVSLKYETNAPFITLHNAFPNLFTAKMFDMTTSDWIKDWCKMVQLSGSVLFLMTTDELVSLPCTQERKALLSLDKPLAVYFGFRVGEAWVLRLAVSLGHEVLALVSMPPCPSTDLRIIRC